MHTYSISFVSVNTILLVMCIDRGFPLSRTGVPHIRVDGLRWWMTGNNRVTSSASIIPVQRGRKRGKEEGREERREEKREREEEREGKREEGERPTA